MQRGLDEATSHYLHVPAQAEASDIQLTVRVTHASLEQADHPVAVGHYRGIPPEGAEGFVDFRLDGLLSRHRELGDYPEDEGEVLFVPADEKRPPGAIVLGLGGFGELTRTKLARLITRAAIRRAMDAAAALDSSDGPPLRVGIATVLIGTPGRYGLSVETSVAALIEGAARAAVRIADSDAGQRVLLAELQILELYEARAAHATAVARDVIERLPLELRDIDLRLPDQIEVGHGGLPGLPSQNASGDPWVRIEVVRDNESRVEDAAAIAPTPAKARPLPRLRYSTHGRSAQIDRLSIEYDEKKVRALIEASIARPGATNTTIALYEQMFPHDAKLELDEADNLQILVDENTAAIPWEMLASATTHDDHEALALRTGMLRQLVRSDAHSATRARIVAPTGRHAMVVGDPPAAGYPRLPGARREASEVEEMLAQEGYTVAPYIYDADRETSDWQEILSGLYPAPYRILHFATHGQVTPGDPATTGLVIGDGKVLTALDFEKMSVTPDLVFINACHVGRTGDSPGDTYRPANRANELAANVALRLMQNGVKAVVAAGWAVDDGAAREFARRFYEGMLGGEAFGNAVHYARRAAHDYDSGRSNTWGAYQCYGDPSFELEPGRRARASSFVPTSAAAVIDELASCARQAEDAFGSQQQEIRRRLDDVVSRALPRFSSSSDMPAMLHALARAYAKLDHYHDAVWAYRQAMLTPACNELPLAALEQLADMEVRLATQLGLRRASTQEPNHPIDRKDLRPAALFNEARRRLEKLLRLAATAERHALLGSHWKKRATTQKTAQRRKSLAAACRSYASASQVSSSGYHTALWAQMAHLGKQPASEVKAARAALGALERRIAARSTHPTNAFASAAELGYIALTRAVLSPSDKSFAKAEQAYVKAFRTHSTARERASVLDHLRDLALLIPAQSEQIEALIDALEASIA